MDVNILMSFFIENIAGVIGLSILVAVVAIIGKLKSKLINTLFIKVKKLFTKEHIEDDIERNKLINQELSRLLFTSNGSRSALFQFHNGSKFTSNSSIWKISSTHEQCEIGTTQESANVQDVKASLLNPLISPLFNGEDRDGLKIITCLRDTCECTSNSNIAVFRVDPDEIKNNYVQNFLIGRGTKFAIISPLLDWHDFIVGFVLLEYCFDGFLTDEQLTEFSELSYKTSKRIYQITQN